MATDKKLLISRIREAFKNVELDGGIGLSEANAMDDYKDVQFRDECKKKMKNIIGIRLLRMH
jgi:hypothetical protein